MREGFAFSFDLSKTRQHCSLSLSVLFYVFRACMRRPGCCRGTELLAIASRQSAPKIVELSARFIPLHIVLFLLVSASSGRRTSPAERKALYVLTVSVYGAAVDYIRR